METMKKFGKTTRLVLVALAIIGVSVYMLPWQQTRDEPLDHTVLTMEDIEKYLIKDESNDKHEKIQDAKILKENVYGTSRNGKPKKDIPIVAMSSKREFIEKLRSTKTEGYNPSFITERRQEQKSAAVTANSKKNRYPPKKRFTNKDELAMEFLLMDDNKRRWSYNAVRKHQYQKKNKIRPIKRMLSTHVPQSNNKKWIENFINKKTDTGTIQKSNGGALYNINTDSKAKGTRQNKLHFEGTVTIKNRSKASEFRYTQSKHRKKAPRNKMATAADKSPFIYSFHNSTKSSNRSTAGRSRDQDVPYDVTIVVPSINSTYVSNLLKSAVPFIYTPPKKVNLMNKMWQKVLDPVYEFYLFSAYFDDRPTLDNLVIRVISMLEIPTPELLCVMWYTNDRMAMLSIAEKMKIGVRYPHHGKKFDPSILSCQIPSDSSPPDYVSIVPVNFPLPTTLMPVRIPEKVDRPFDFGACVSVSYWHHEQKRVVEWMELQKMWGVSEVTIYNDNMTAESLRVFQYYANQGYVDLQEITNIFNDNNEISYWMNMSPAINDCMYRNMYRYKKVICIDIDEIIVPRLDNTYKDVIERFDKQKPRKHPYKSYMFRNVYFFLDFGSVRNDSNLVTLRYLRSIQPSSFGYSVKCITDPLVCEGLQNHVCWHVVPRYKYLGWLDEVTPEIAMNQHYKNCHLDNLPDAVPNACKTAMANNTIDKTMLRFASDLEERTTKVFDDLQIQHT